MRRQEGFPRSLRLMDMRPPEDLVEFMGKISSASVVTRYPGDLSRTVAAYPATVAEEYLSKTREVLQWLRQDKRLLQS
jgi:HEPN domain-containing protein